jgi:hypothetical protein
MALVTHYMARERAREWCVLSQRGRQNACRGVKRQRKQATQRQRARAEHRDAAALLRHCHQRAVRRGRKHRRARAQRVAACCFGSRVRRGACSRRRGVGHQHARAGAQQASVVEQQRARRVGAHAVKPPARVAAGAARQQALRFADMRRDFGVQRRAAAISAQTLRT